MHPKLPFALCAALLAGTALAQSGTAAAPSAPSPAATPTAPAQAAPADRAAPMHRRLDRHFAPLDKNGDGMLTREEAAGDKWLSEHFDRIDANHDGKISRDELRAYTQAMRSQRAEKFKARFEAGFKAADQNGDGALTREEAEAGKLRWIVRHFDQIDANRDGKVTREEVRAYWDSMRARGAERIQQFEARFKAADQNGDGALTREEATAGKLDWVVQHFDQIDVNKTGRVTLADIRAYMRSQRHHKRG